MADAIINAAAETVQDGLDGPLGDRDGDTTSPPVASTILSQHIQSVEETAPQRSKTRACYTSLLHQQHLERSENSFDSTASADPDCYTNLLHQPCKRAPSPSARSPHPKRTSPSGLIVRGRFFHVRVKVPRKAQATVGRTEVWRSTYRGRRDGLFAKASHSRPVRGDFRKTSVIRSTKSDTCCGLAASISKRTCSPSISHLT